MILRKSSLLCIAITIVLTIKTTECQDAEAKTYDENDWIPIAPKHAQSAQPVLENVEKKATGRVLNLAEVPANSFFPEEVKPQRNNNVQQYLRETTTYQKPSQLQTQNLHVPSRAKSQAPHPYKFESARPLPRPAKPQNEYYVQQVPQQTQQPQQAQFVQYYQPEEYHTIPEEYLHQPLPQPQQQQQYFSQNFEIPDLPPIRLNATTSSKEERRPKPQIDLKQKKPADNENVQLLYVPLESLQGQLPLRQDLPRLHAYQQAPVVDLPPQFQYRPVAPAKQQQIHNIQSDFAKQAFDAHKLQLQLQQQPQPQPEEYASANIPVESPTTTTKKPASKKRKAHQPPLAVYMGGASTADVNEVLAILKDAKTIEVQDSIGPNSPKIFVGPSTLETPRGYTKFELPYLSSLDTNRAERKVDQYPFFVAPLSYKAPAGYSKIPLPSPHVGSVVVSTKEKPSQHPQLLQQPQQQVVHNHPNTYQQFTLQTQQQNIPQFEQQQRPHVTSSTPRYKVAPEEHVIKQHEIDQINAFIPQFNENFRPETRFPQREPERIPEEYHIKSFQSIPTERHPVERPRPSTIRFASTPQPQISEQEFIDDIIHQQQQHHQQPSSVESQEEFRPVLLPQNEGQFLQEITRAPSSSASSSQEQQDNVKHERPTSSIRVRPTSTPVDSYEQEEITKAPTRIRTRPTTQSYVRESYENPTRTSHVRTRPTTPAPVSLPEPNDQYLKETVIEPRPKVNPVSTTEKPKYSIQEQFSIGRSTTPSSLHYTPIAQEYEEEIKPHRPVIYKYKQSEEIEPEPQYHQPVYTQSTLPPRGHNQLNQEALDSKVLPNTHETTGNFVSGPGQQIYQFQSPQIPQHQDEERYEEPDDRVKTQNANVENYHIHAPQPQSQLPNLINNLEDQSVRQLLQPGLIPTSPKTNANIESYELSTHSPPISSTTQLPSSNYPSTHLPILDTDTTTPRRTTVSRGRVRGSRFSTTTPSSVSSTRRAPVTRGRRPLPSRTRNQESDSEYTTETNLVRSTTDPTKRIVTARSRFRTRGRPVAETTDRVSAVYDQVDVTSSHTQSHVPSVQIIEPQVTQRVTPEYNQKASPEYINYRPVYNVPVDQSELVLVSNKKVNKPATEPVVIHQINQLPIKNLEEENTENTSSKLRTRGRRPLPSTTASPQVETSRRYETNHNSDREEEFYGFFREPSFKKPTEAAPPAETPRAVYSSTYVSSTLKPYTPNEDKSQIRYQAHPTTENVQFVGEIRPKYQTTAQYYEASQPSVSTERYYQSTEREVVEEEKPKLRTRVRIPSRTRVTNTESTHNEDTKPTQRTRTRGKTHYRVPQKPKRPQESSEDEDVEGGNYPPQFKTYQTTARPSFQITVDPADDQEGFHSIYRPTYVAKDNSKDDYDKESEKKDNSQYVENYQNPNYITTDVKSNHEEPFALPSIATAPEVNFSIQEEQDKVARNQQNLDKIVEQMIHDYEDNSESQTEGRTSDPFDITATTIMPETTTHKRRRGVWKLVRRPVDVLEGAESQNAAGNKNSLDNFESKKDFAQERPEYTTLPMTTVTEFEINTSTPSSTTTEGGFFNSLYDMFGISEEKVRSAGQEKDEHEEIIATTVKPIIETTFVPEAIETEAQSFTTIPTTTTTTTTTTPSPIEFETTTPMTSMTYITPMSLETWNKGILKTSTSTEISHETEICYKGKCIKSKDMKVPLK